MTKEKTYCVYLTCTNCDHNWVELVSRGIQYHGQSECPNCGCLAGTRRRPTEQERLAADIASGLDPTPEGK